MTSFNITQPDYDAGLTEDEYQERVNAIRLWIELGEAWTADTGMPPMASHHVLISEARGRRGLVEIVIPKSSLRPYSMYLYLDPKPNGRQLHEILVGIDTFDGRGFMRDNSQKFDSPEEIWEHVKDWLLNTRASRHSVNCSFEPC